MHVAAKLFWIKLHVFTAVLSSSMISNSSYKYNITYSVCEHFIKVVNIVDRQNKREHKNEQINLVR